jgi:diadenosine tetraphosphate (Ap4A) HIT family hydrolase
VTVTHLLFDFFGTLVEYDRAGCDPAYPKTRQAIRDTALALKTAFDCPGVSTRQHNEPAGNQDVWHLHVHVFPRFESDGFGFTFAERYFNSLPDRSALDEAAARIRASICQTA